MLNFDFIFDCFASICNFLPTITMSKPSFRMRFGHMLLFQIFDTEYMTWTTQKLLKNNIFDGHWPWACVSDLALIYRSLSLSPSLTFNMQKNDQIIISHNSLSIYSFIHVFMDALPLYNHFCSIEEIIMRTNGQFLHWE